MRLLTCSDAGELNLSKDLMDDDDIPSYAILSHTWQHGQEVTFEDLMNDTGKNKAGLDKIRFCGQQAQRDKLSNFWVDTCCINKADSVELQDAINSMFRWYQNAAQCYVYLWDVSTRDGLSESVWDAAFRASRWFTRGWTLQELIAPRNVTFFSREGKQLGDRRSLERKIHEITGIAIRALQAESLSTFTVDERLSWMQGRTTTRKEDKVYSLLGMFGIYLLPNYGEGEQYAFKRFYRELEASKSDLFRQQMSTLASDVYSDAEKEHQGPWLVPFSRPKSFTGREKQLAHLRTLISLGGDHRLAIHGLGGCGKTALALEFAYWTKKHHTTHAIFWVPATSQGSFEKAYYDIAKLLDIPGYSDSQVNIKDLVKSHLSDSNFGPWLIIVDNADNVDLLFGDDGEDRDHGPLISYLPQSSRGCIVFTTRIRATAIKAAENNIIELGDLERREATEILCRRLFHEHHSELKMVETVSEFLEMLRFHALAIIQAIAFINTNDVSLADYITLYRHSEGDAMDLLSEEFEDQTRYQEASNSVATTWFVSFEQIQKHDAVAADHLFFMACIANNEITASMFPPIYSKVQHTKAIGMLKAYAFITERQPQSDKLWVQPQTIHKTFDIHPLVHLAIRGWLKAHDQWTLWTRKTMARLVEIVPYGDHDTRDYWTTYMHHAMHLLNQSEVQELSGRMALLEKIGRCERSLGRYQASERAYRRAFDQRVRTSGAENPETLMTMGNIALALGYQERWMEAEKMHKEELAIAEKVLGKKSPQTLISRGNLGLAMLGQWKFREAEELYRELLELDKEVLGEKSTETLAAMQNLAGALCGQGKHAEAEQVHRKTLALSKEIRGEEHADTLSSLSALGTALRSQCKYIEAEQIHHEELVLRKKVLGDEHPDTVKTMQKLGNVLCVQERYVEAEKIQREALAISSKELGDENPVTLKCWSALAHTLHNQKHYAEAEQIHRNTLAVREKVMGKVHRDTLMSVYWLAELLHDQMQYQNAMQLYDRALAGFQSTLGPEHSVTKECLELCTWIREAVDEERIAEAAKREQCIANEAATEDAVVGAQVSSTAEVALRPHKRWRARLHRIVNKSTGR